MANVVDPQMQGQEPQPQSSGSGKGCLWGCLIVGGLFVASILCAGFGGYWFLSRQVEKYTSETPVKLPTVEYSEEDLAALEARVESFKEKLDAGETPDEDLILTADDINALITKNEDLKGRVFVKIENNQVEGDVSFPLDKLPMGKGRYFNGSATFDVSMDDGFLVVTAQEATVNGEAVPDEFMEGLRQENLAKEVYKDPENEKFMRQFEDIRVEDNKFILRVKRDQDSGGVEENPLMESTEEAAGTEASGGTEAPAEAEGPTEVESSGNEDAGSEGAAEPAEEETAEASAQ